LNEKILDKLIALGGKIIDYLGRSAYIRCAKALIVGGLAIIGGASSPVWLPFAQALFEEVTEIEVIQYIESINLFLVCIGFLVILLGVCLIVIDKKISSEKVDKVKKALEIRHTSIESNVSFEKSTKDTVIEINQVRKMDDYSLYSIQSALDMQNDKFSELTVMLNNEDYENVKYKALAHIPLTFLAGYQISDKISLIYFEWNQNDFSWSEINDNTEPYQELINMESEILESGSDNVAIKIGVTYPVSDSDVLDTQVSFKRIYSLSLEEPKRNSIVSRSQLMEYKTQFRDLMDNINQNNREVNNVHIFYSGQPSLAFILGSSISKRMDKNIFVHNHTATETPKYSWGIKLHKSDDKKNVIFNWGR
jgi:hypothetical protein